MFAPSVPKESREVLRGDFVFDRGGLRFYPSPGVATTVQGASGQFNSSVYVFVCV